MKEKDAVDKKNADSLEEKYFDLFPDDEYDSNAKQRILDFALRNTDINLWYFNCETGECFMGENCQKAHEMPGEAMLYGFPECLFEIGYVREDSIEPLREAYNKLWETGENLEFDAWFRKADGSGWWCERDMLTAILGPDGKVIRGVGVGKEVTAEKELQEKYRTFQSYRSLAEKDTIASFRLNLTAGLFEDCASGNQFVLQAYSMSTVDDFFQTAISYIPEADREHFEPMFSTNYLLESFFRGEMSFSLEYRYCSQIRERIIWLRTDVDMIQSPVTGDVEALLHTYDIDYQKNSQLMADKLLTTDYEFIGMFDVATGYLMVFCKNGDELGMAQNATNFDIEIPRVFQNLIQPEYLDEAIRTMSRSHVISALVKKESYTCSFPTKSFVNMKAGRKQWKFEYMDGTRTQILMTRTDIADVYTTEYDELTGLYNRQAFYRHARELLDLNPTDKFLLIRFDIDRFKAFNDVWGTQEGDRLLAGFGRTVRRRDWPKPSVFGRLEADHFVSIMPADTFDIFSWHASQRNAVETAIPGYRLTSSVGIYEINEPGVDISLMCDRALLALYTVKDSYDVKLAWYNESLREKLMGEQALCDEMEQALLTGQFVLYFQPQIDYPSKVIIGAEVLVRWKHPKRGMIPPVKFIPIFEKNGFILKLDAYVWEESCRYLRHCLDCGSFKTVLPLSVNVSRCDLYDHTLCSRLKDLIQRYDLPPTLLKLEITESAYMDDPEQLIEVVKELRCIGFTVEMDDFGAGYSSLNMLKDVPVDLVKLDMKFLSGSKEDLRGTAILSSVISMADMLKLPVIAEGVETEIQADYLQGLGCFTMQGYYFGRPMPKEEFEEILEKK